MRAPRLYATAASLLLGCSGQAVSNPAPTPPQAQANATQTPAGVEPVTLPASPSSLPSSPTVIAQAPTAAPQREATAAEKLAAARAAVAAAEFAELQAAEAARETLDTEGAGLQVLSSGVGVEDIIVGHGAEVQSGKRLSVHYVGRLQDSSVFDSSRKRGTPFTYEFGAGRVIKGWEEGIKGMRVGGVRRLLIPPHMGYGERGRPPMIPANAILEFEIEVLDMQ